MTNNSLLYLAIGGAATLICRFLALVAGLQIWKRNTALSIVCGTVCYMVLIRIL